MGPAARSVNGLNAFERLFSSLKNAWDLWAKVENIESVAGNTTVTPGTIGTQNIEPVMVEMPLYHYDVHDVPGNKPTVGNPGHHDTVVNPSQTRKIDVINKRNYEIKKREADSIGKAKGF